MLKFSGWIDSVKMTAVIGCLIMMGSSCADAMKISEYLAARDNSRQKSLIDVYLKGYIHGLFNANDVLEARGQKQLFCMPDSDTFLRAGNYTDLVDIIISKNPVYKKDDTTIETAIISNLVNSYPCSSPSAKQRK